MGDFWSASGVGRGETMPRPHSTSKTERIQGLVTRLFIEPFIFLFMKCID